jgi:hypothetical protein
VFSRRLEAEAEDGVDVGPFSMASIRLKWTQDEAKRETGMDLARWSSVRYRLRSFSILCRHCTAVLAGAAAEHRRATESATSCQWVAFRFPLLSEYHFSRYESIKATVSSCDQHGGGKRLDTVPVPVVAAVVVVGVGWVSVSGSGGAGRERGSGTAVGGPGEAAMGLAGLSMAEIASVGGGEDEEAIEGFRAKEK